MSLPKINALQYLLLAQLFSGEKVGSDIRATLERQGEERKGPAFYQFMSRLETTGYIEGRYSQKIVDGQRINERLYKLTPNGISEWMHTRDFYAEAALGISQETPTPTKEEKGWEQRMEERKSKKRDR